jgi:hypothetical protein
VGLSGLTDPGYLGDDEGLIRKIVSTAPGSGTSLRKTRGSSSPPFPEAEVGDHFDIAILWPTIVGVPADDKILSYPHFHSIW